MKSKKKAKPIVLDFSDPKVLAAWDKSVKPAKVEVSESYIKELVKFLKENKI